MELFKNHPMIHGKLVYPSTRGTHWWQDNPNFRPFALFSGVSLPDENLLTNQHVILTWIYRPHKLLVIKENKYKNYWSEEHGVRMSEKKQLGRNPLCTSRIILFTHPYAKPTTDKWPVHVKLSDVLGNKLKIFTLWRKIPRQICSGYSSVHYFPFSFLFSAISIELVLTSKLAAQWEAPTSVQNTGNRYVARKLAGQLGFKKNMSANASSITCTHTPVRNDEAEIWIKIHKWGTVVIPSVYSDNSVTVPLSGASEKLDRNWKALKTKG